MPLPVVAVEVLQHLELEEVVAEEEVVVLIVVYTTMDQASNCRRHSSLYHLREYNIISASATVNYSTMQSDPR